MTMKKADYEKEKRFVEYFAITGNASESCVKAGYKKETSAQMGYYLKDKLRDDIEKYREDVLFDMSGSAITKLKALLDSESDSVSLGACKHILELSGYSAEQNINIRTNTQKDLDKMTDEELYMKLIEFTKDLNMPFEVIEKKKFLS